ncbi:hypothetical protein LOK49_LG08G00482 [Camellia lanceoleosa]|uniref:Uncharacterized protein n=1 Tax=Camellia lanceoleosa TaxID=1840588 RepID=A0ACC0GRH3_9ERIC|nr:hypothetical protein LOK49_LG08G00482 [Camellia lanceoleosa]
MSPMTEQAAHELISKVPEWNLVNEGSRLKLSRSWKVKTFFKGLEFFQAIAYVAEAEENDFILASKIDRLRVQHLLGRNATY